MAMMRPNIVYIHSHDTGRYVQPYGHAIATPNIQRLASQGALFRQAFCAAPTCSPSRAALLTGQCPHSAGMLGLAHRGFSLRDTRQHVIHALHAAGYASAMTGRQHVSADPGTLGYHRIYTTSSDAAEISAGALESLSKPPHQPFFLSVGYQETHRRFHAPSVQEDGRYCLPPGPLPDCPAVREDMAAFKASARVFDDQVGKVLAALDASGLADGTLVICTTDHGIAFPFMKCNLTDHGIGVMLIMRGPGGFAGGKVLDGMVSQIDIFPTLCELLRIDRPAWLQGRSILPLIDGRSERINDEIFAEVTYHAAYEPMRAVRTQRWKYIRRYEPRAGPVLSNIDASPSKDALLECGMAASPPAAEQLYDLVFDPSEASNLVSDASRASVLADMRRRLDDWMRRTDDPLLRGPVPAPSGAKITDSDSPSPEIDVRVVP